MKRVLSVAPTRHLLALVGLAFAASVGSLTAADHYYVNDHLATTTAVTDAAGEIAAIEADAFGTPVAGATQAARFTGKPYDDDIGAFVFPFRNYRSDEARWMSADPSGFPDGVNANAYAPKPTLQVDPTGLATGTFTLGAPDTYAVQFVVLGPDDGATPSLQSAALTGWFTSVSFVGLASYTTELTGPSISNLKSSDGAVQNHYFTRTWIGDFDGTINIKLNFLPIIGGQSLGLTKVYPPVTTSYKGWTLNVQVYRE